jgi:RNA polymerase sigma-70 factor (ECF subfamily)
MSETRWIAAARAGDGSGFGALVEPFRGELYAHCRRLLRSDHDAEDALQEVLLRAWRGLGQYEGRASLRSWLYRIATNVCLNEIDRRKRRPPVATDEPVEQAGPDGPAPGELSDALAVAHERLSPGQRAALLLRDGFGYTAPESAKLLGTTTVSVNSALQRARVSVDRASSAESHAFTTETVRRYQEAVEHDDIEGFVAMLRGDASPARRHWNYA